MKKIIILSLFVFFIFVFVPTLVSADVIPPNSHSLDRCVKIVNLNEFPNIILIGLINTVQGGKETYTIKSQECLTKGYKFNSFKIYWNTSDKPSLIDSNKLLSDSIEPYGGYISEKNPLIKEDIEYSLAGLSDGKLVLYKTKQTSEYNNGTPIKVEIFNSSQDENKIEPTPVPSPTPVPTPSPQPSPVKRGFWGFVGCFFRTLFGGSCQ